MRVSRSARFLLLAASLAVLVWGCNRAEKKALRDLVQGAAGQAEGTAPAGRVLEAISVFEQAQGLEQSELCRGAARLYAQLSRAVRDRCADQTLLDFCDAVADVFYGGSFPPFGPRICLQVAGERCNELLGREAEILRLSREIARACEQ